MCLISVMLEVRQPLIKSSHQDRLFFFWCSSRKLLFSEIKNDEIVHCCWKRPSWNGFPLRMITPTCISLRSLTSGELMNEKTLLSFTCSHRWNTSCIFQSEHTGMYMFFFLSSLLCFFKGAFLHGASFRLLDSVMYMCTEVEKLTMCKESSLFVCVKSLFIPPGWSPNVPYRHTNRCCIWRSPFSIVYHFSLFLLPSTAALKFTSQRRIVKRFTGSCWFSIISNQFRQKS